MPSPEVHDDRMLDIVMHVNSSLEVLRWSGAAPSVFTAGTRVASGHLYYVAPRTAGAPSTYTWLAAKSVSLRLAQVSVPGTVGRPARVAPVARPSRL